MKRVVFNNSSIFHEHIKFGETPENILWDYKAFVDTKKDGIDIAKDICAFANKFGGTLLIGVSEKNSLANDICENNDFGKIKRFINEKVLKMIQPKICVDTVLLEIRGKQIIAVNIEPLIYALACVTITNESYSYFERSEHGNKFLTPLEIEKRIITMDYRQHQLFLQEKVPLNGNDNVIFIPATYKKECNSLIEFKPNNSHIREYNEWDFQVSIDGRTLNIPYSAIKKVWIDVFNKVNFELDLMIVLDKESNKLKLEPVYINFIKNYE